MTRRNGVKKQIFKDMGSGVSKIKSMARRDRSAVAAKANLPSSLRERSVTPGTATNAGAVVLAVAAGADTLSSLRERGVTPGTATHAATVVVAGADPSSLFERSVTTGTSVGVRQSGFSMTPAERAKMYSTKSLPPSLAAEVDQSLNAGSALTRSDLTASIHVKVPSADSLEYEGSRLYKDETGDWVADLVPENIAEKDASSRTQVMGVRIDRPTPTMV